MILWSSQLDSAVPVCLEAVQRRSAVCRPMRVPMLVVDRSRYAFYPMWIQQPFLLWPAHLAQLTTVLWAPLVFTTSSTPNSIVVMTSTTASAQTAPSLTWSLSKRQSNAVVPFLRLLRLSLVHRTVRQISTANHWKTWRLAAVDGKFLTKFAGLPMSDPTVPSFHVPKALGHHVPTERSVKKRLTVVIIAARSERKKKSFLLSKNTILSTREVFLQTNLMIWFWTAALWHFTFRANLFPPLLEEVILFV